LKDGLGTKGGERRIGEKQRILFIQEENAGLGRSAVQEKTVAQEKTGVRVKSAVQGGTVARARTAAKVS